MSSVPDILQQKSWKFNPRKYISNDPNHPVKLCFVTVGATATFNSLVREVLSLPFLTALQKQNYTHLLVQHGSLGYEVFEKLKREHGRDPKEQFGLNIEGFDFNVEGLKQEMMTVKANPGVNRLEGMIISHAGKTLHFHLIFEVSAADTINVIKARVQFLKPCDLESHWLLCRTLSSCTIIKLNSPTNSRLWDT